MKLKDATEVRHKRLESRLDLLNQASTLRDYQKLLTRFFGFYSAVEPQVAAALSQAKIDFDFAARHKTPLLLRDLSALGFDPTEIDSLPVCQSMLNLATPAQIFGYLYVAEGSTLGGQLLSRHFAEKFGLTESNGGAFFRAYGERTGMMWREFQATLNAFAVTDEQQHVMAATANETFEMLEVWLCE